MRARHARAGRVYTYLTTTQIPEPSDLQTTLLPAVPQEAPRRERHRSRAALRRLALGLTVLGLLGLIVAAEIHVLGGTR